MKKKLFPKLLFAFMLPISIYMISCNTSKTTTVQFGTSVTPVTSLLALPIYNTPLLFGSQNFTMGLLFKSAKNGRITHLGARLAKGSYTVALWDSSAQVLIKSAQITVTDSTQLVFADINDVSITANKYYAISVNNTPNGTTEFRSYWLYSISSPADNFPHTVGDITFTSEIELHSTNPLVLFPPDYLANNYVIGVPEFKFEPQL